MDMNDALKAEVGKVAAAVEKEMEALLPSTTLEESFLFSSMAYSSLAKAKRLRAFLVVETARLFGVNIKQALAVASAIEFVHAYSLIHDDLPAMDDADTRRGIPANHIKYDEATAILAGDALIPLAYETISNSRNIPDAEIRCELILELSKTIGGEGMVGGQALDMLSEKRPLSYKTMMRMQELKTGKMFIFSCLSGAILGKASNVERKALYEYAKKLGTVFQITDDILDEVGEEEKVGKPLRRDNVSKKTTFISLYGLGAARAEAVHLIHQACEELNVFEQDTSKLKNLARYLMVRTH